MRQEKEKEKGSVGDFSPDNGRVRSRRAAPESKHRRRTRSVAAVMPQVDHRASEGFESVVQFTDTIKAHQQATELENHLEASYRRAEARRG
jgi:hypothetical protein